MLTCREATQLLSEKQDRILNFKEMSALQFHVLMCSSCRRFGKQMKSLSLLSKQYKKFLCTRQISQNPYPIRVLPS
ncbi:MAG: zf-HC2 domain-containing protein [Acinetobacter sp.]